jgi:hypothetical protein
MTCLALLLWETISSPNAVLLAEGKFMHIEASSISPAASEASILEYAVTWILSYVIENSS